MPIRPENKARYPSDWTRIADAIRVRSGFRCECVGECGGPHPTQCGELDGQRPVTFAHANHRVLVVLTVAHLDHQPENCEDGNLRAYCQACHLRYDGHHHRVQRRQNADRARVSRLEAAGQVRLF